MQKKLVKTMKNLILLLVVSACLHTSACVNESRLYFNGLYKAENGRYLRFYEDGTVLATTVSSDKLAQSEQMEVEKIAQSFAKELIRESYFASGKYKFIAQEGSKLTFTTTTNDISTSLFAKYPRAQQTIETIIYEGTINGKELTLETKNTRNGYQRTYNYVFIQFPGQP